MKSDKAATKRLTAKKLAAIVVFNFYQLLKELYDGDESKP
jgi:hypothetical protein